ncbi:hypothetical protein [Streptomyces sp. B6B3]|uniref:hypothetical protein n=1 Tax=Streptomyces sp. B6B3 TaxID=3153570 RepID=UPI00325CBDD9
MLWSDWCEERDERPNGAARSGEASNSEAGNAATMLRRCWWVTAASAVLAFLLIR